MPMQMQMQQREKMGKGSVPSTAYRSVQDLLETLGLAKYAELLEDADYNCVSLLASCTEAHLREVGLTHGAARAIYLALHSGAATASADGGGHEHSGQHSGQYSVMSTGMGSEADE